MDLEPTAASVSNDTFESHGRTMRSVFSSPGFFVSGMITIIRKYFMCEELSHHCMYVKPHINIATCLACKGYIVEFESRKFC